MGSAGPAGAPGINPANEAVLLTALSHPSIVQIFKSATLRVQGALASSGSGSWAGGTPPRPLSPQSPRSPRPPGAPLEARPEAPAEQHGPSPPHGEPRSPQHADVARDMAAVNLAALEAAQAASIAGSSGGLRSSGSHSGPGTSPPTEPGQYEVNASRAVDECWMLKRKKHESPLP